MVGGSSQQGKQEGSVNRRSSSMGEMGIFLLIGVPVLFLVTAFCAIAAAGFAGYRALFVRERRQA